MNEKHTEISPNFFWLCGCFACLILGLFMGMETSKDSHQTSSNEHQISSVKLKEARASLNQRMLILEQKYGDIIDQGVIVPKERLAELYSELEAIEKDHNELEEKEVK